MSFDIAQDDNNFTYASYSTIAIADAETNIDGKKSLED